MLMKFDLTGERKEGSNVRRGENRTGWNMHPLFTLPSSPKLRCNVGEGKTRP
jgi:hypothetical protein